MNEDSKGAEVAHDATCVVVPRSERGWGSNRRPCGKPAKGTLRNGSPACGVHLAAEKRSDDNYAKWEADRAEKMKRAQEADKACAEIRMRLSALKPSPYRPSFGPLRGGPNPEYVVVRVDALLALLDGGAQ